MEFFDHLNARMGLHALQDLCRARDLPTAVSWEGTREKLEERSREGPEQAAAVMAALRSIYVESLTVGRRAVRLFELEHPAALSMLDHLKGLEPEASVYMDAFPAPLSAAELQAAPGGVHLCSVISAGPSAVTLLFCGRRIVEERQSRRRDELAPALVSGFGWQQFDEFVLIKRQYVQSFEVVRLDAETNRVEIRIEDHPGVDVGVALEELTLKANSLLSTRFGVENQLISGLNLFPAIRHLYADAAAGVVVELAFSTETGSIKHEKMRHKGEDLRLELWHVGGKRAVAGVLTPFRIAVRWSSDSGRFQEEVLLPGSVRQLASTRPFLDHMVLSGAPSEVNMQVMINRVVSHLTAPADVA